MEVETAVPGAEHHEVSSEYIVCHSAVTVALCSVIHGCKPPFCPLSPETYQQYLYHECY